MQGHKVFVRIDEVVQISNLQGAQQKSPGILAGDRLAICPGHLADLVGIAVVALLQQVILIADQGIGILVLRQRQLVDDRPQHHRNLPGGCIIDIGAVMGVDPFGLQIASQRPLRGQFKGLRIEDICHIADCFGYATDVFTPVGSAVDKTRRELSAFEGPGGGGVENSSRLFPITDQKAIRVLQIGLG